MLRRIVQHLLNLLSSWRARGRTELQIDRTSDVFLFRLRASGATTLNIGKECWIRCRLMFDGEGGRISVGDRVYIGRSLIICHKRIEIADDVIISWGVTITDHNSHALDWNDRSGDVQAWRQGKKDWSEVRSAPVIIERRCWLGFESVVLKGVRIGEGAIVAARAVVTRDVPPYTVVAGNPAQVVRKLDTPDD